MAANSLQTELFNQIKTLLPPHLSMVETIGSLLNVSADSVYRRIRGEKSLPLEELKILCEHFQLSLDHVLQVYSDKIVFTDPEILQPVNNYQDYLRSVYDSLKYFNSFKRRELMYLSKDVPIFHFFISKELAAFKSFFWSRSILNEPGFESRKFSVDDQLDEETWQMTQKVLTEYNAISSVELWNLESISSTTAQIEFYRDAGIFKTNNDLNKVIDSVHVMLGHLERQVERGVKFVPGTNGNNSPVSLKFFVNELILGNNSIMVELDGNRLSFLNYVVLKYISTSDTKFTNRMFDNFFNLRNRSIMISETGERERVRFFNKLKERVEACRI